MKISNPFDSLFQKKEFLGVDIGTASIKMVELVSKKSGVELKNYGILETKGHVAKVNQAIQTSSLEIIDTNTIDLLRTLLEKIKPGTQDVVASIPAFSAFTSLIEIPDMADSETTQAMEYQARNLVPLPLEKVHLDWFRVGRSQNENGSKQQQIFMVAVAKSQIEKYQKIFTQVGLKLKALEIETVASARSLTSKDPTLTLVIDIGARSSAFSIAQNGVLLHSAQSDFAGNSLTQAVSKGLSINPARAEELKKQKGLMGRGGEYEVSTLMLPYLDVILNEAKRVKEAYETSHSVRVERIVLSGGGANLLGLEKYTSQQLQLPAVKAEPFEGNISTPKAMAPLTKELGPPLSVAVGLGLRQFSNQ